MSIELIQYTSYTDASNRAGNSLCENWKHQWIFGESKLKPSNLLHIFSSDLSKAKFINSQADLHCLKKAARGSQTYRHGINRSMDGNIWASPFRTMDAVPSPIASVASASWCRRCYVVFFVGWCETEPFVFPWVDIFSVGRILKRTPVFFFFSISDFFMISCKTTYWTALISSDVLSTWSSSMFWGSVTVSLKEKMAPGSVDNGLQESFHGLRVKGEACVWCGGVSGCLRWDEVKIGWRWWTAKQEVFRGLLKLA